MKHLFVALKRKDALAMAEAHFPRSVDLPGTANRWETADGQLVRVAIYGENLEGNTFDRIWLTDQKKASAAAKDYLIWRLAPDGMFMTGDPRNE